MNNEISTCITTYFTDSDTIKNTYTKKASYVHTYFVIPYQTRYWREVNFGNWQFHLILSYVYVYAYM